MTVQPTDLTALRRWIRRRQSAHRERGATAGNVYFGVLFVAIVGGMLHEQVAVVFWPDAPNASSLAGLALVAAGAGGLFLALRRLGPLGLSRPAASWLLTAPVSRRRLLLPSLRVAVLGAGLAGALIGLAVTGHVATRPMPGSLAAALLTGSALGGIVVVLLALAAQAASAGGVWADRLAGLVLAAGLAGFVVDSAVDAPRPAGDWPAGRAGLAVAALAVVVVALLAGTVARLGATPNERILESAQTAGTLLDSAFGVEPSFVTEMIERRYWATRRLRSRRLWTRVPPLVAQDLLLTVRRPRRLLWTAGSVALPALLAHFPPVVMGLALLLGGLVAGGAPTANVRTDAANPVLLRLIGLDSRQAISQRIWVPGVLAGLWYAAAFGTLHALGDLPGGPWWAVGLVLGPAGGAAAVRKARVGFVRNDLMAFDTQMGVSISPGPLFKGIFGPDALILGLPALLQILQGRPATWGLVLVQGVVAVIGVRGYIAGTTGHDRVELSSGAA
jgi:hypothetical protein